MYGIYVKSECQSSKKKKKKTKLKKIINNSNKTLHYCPSSQNLHTLIMIKMEKIKSVFFKADI